MPPNFLFKEIPCFCANFPIRRKCPSNQKSSVGYARQRQFLRRSSSLRMRRLYSSSPTGSPGSNRGVGFITSVPFFSSISSIAPSSMPSFDLSSTGIVTCPFRLTRIWDNLFIVLLVCSRTKKHFQSPRNLSSTLKLLVV
jgi:hypothetical protein